MLFLEYSSRFSLSVLVLALERDRDRTGLRSGLEKDTGLGTRTRLSFNLERDTRLGPD